jgi:hypothetical protein
MFISTYFDTKRSYSFKSYVPLSSSNCDNVFAQEPIDKNLVFVRRASNSDICKCPVRFSESDISHITLLHMVDHDLSSYIKNRKRCECVTLGYIYTSATKERVFSKIKLNNQYEEEIDVDAIQKMSKDEFKKKIETLKFQDQQLSPTFSAEFYSHKITGDLCSVVNQLVSLINKEFNIELCYVHYLDRELLGFLCFKELRRYLFMEQFGFFPNSTEFDALDYDIDNDVLINICSNLSTMIKEPSKLIFKEKSFTSIKPIIHLLENDFIKVTELDITGHHLNEDSKIELAVFMFKQYVQSQFKQPFHMVKLIGFDWMQFLPKS